MTEPQCSAQGLFGVICYLPNKLERKQFIDSNGIYQNWNKCHSLKIEIYSALTVDVVGKRFKQKTTCSVKHGLSGVWKKKIHLKQHSK